MPLEILCADVTVEGAYAPHFLRSSLQIPPCRNGIFDSQCSQDMRPLQIVQTRLHNFQVIECQIETSKILKITFAETFAVCFGQFLGKHFYQLRSIFGAFFAFLPLLHDALSYAPIGLNHHRVHGSVCRIAPLLHQSFDVTDEGFRVAM